MTLYHPENSIEENFPFNTSKLKSLSIDNDWISDANVIELVNQSPRLSEFSLSCSTDNVTMNIFNNFNSHFFEQLTVLDFSLCKNGEYNHRALERIASECHNMVYCKIHHEVDKTIDPDEIWLKLFRNNPHHLTILHISNVRNPGPILNAISSQFPGLVELVVRCQRSGGHVNTFNNVLDKCRNITTFRVEGHFVTFEVNRKKGDVPNAVN